MKVRLGMDQTTAWLLAILGTGLVFGGLYAGLNMMAKRHQMAVAAQEEDPHASKDGHGEHGKKAGDGHGAGGHEAGGHGAHDAGAQHKATDKPASELHGEDSHTSAAAASHGADSSTPKAASKHEGDHEAKDSHAPGADKQHDKHDSKGAGKGHGDDEESHDGGEHHGEASEPDAGFVAEERKPYPGKGEHPGSAFQPHGDEASTSASSLAAPAKRPGVSAAALAADEAASDWSYDGRTGPEFWGDLNKNYAACHKGRQQSPVNIKGVSSSPSLQPLKFFYKTAQLSLKNTGTTLKAPYGEGSYVMYNGMRYDLLEFHFHLPSEHAVDGVPYDMELHLVHQNADGNLGYIAVFMQEGRSDHEGLDPIWQNLPSTRLATGSRVSFNATSLLPKGHTYYSFEGSTTTPPCREGVRWLVMQEPIKISPNQLDRFITIYRNNARPLQALNERRIHVSSPS